MPKDVTTVIIRQSKISEVYVPGQWRYGARAYVRGLDEFGNECKPHYPVPATIGFQTTRWGTYLYDTVKGMDGMPLFHGYMWSNGTWH